MNMKELAEIEPKKTMSIIDIIESSRKNLENALPEGMSAKKMQSIALTCLRQNPDLLNCTPASFMGALYTSAQLGLEPIAGLSYLIPFNNSKKVGNEWVRSKDVQFVIGYKGIVSLFYRHSSSVALTTGVVREGDEFYYEQGTDPYLKHKPLDNNKGKPIGYWVVAKLLNGGTTFKYMTHDECMAHAKQHSKTWNSKQGQFYASSPWATATESMCIKTVMLQLSKFLPLSVDLQRAIQVDESCKSYNAESKLDIIDVPSETNWDEKAIDDDDIAEISEGVV